MQYLPFKGGYYEDFFFLIENAVKPLLILSISTQKGMIKHPNLLMAVTRTDQLLVPSTQAMI